MNYCSVMWGAFDGIRVNDLHKSYGENDNKVEVIKGISATIKKGEICTILGPSGSGKSTFMNLLGGLECPDSGDIIIGTTNISKMKNKQLSEYRRGNVSFVFQFYNLISNLNVRENIQTCEYLTNAPLDIDELLDVLDLKKHQKKFPSQLSGGQQQRCAIARALVKNPKILFCDEPTGALDYKNSKEILKLLEKVNERYSTTILMVTHNEAIKLMSDRILYLKDGLIVNQEINDIKVKAEDIEW